MLLPGQGVVAGISGGADSVCLLFVLLEWRKRYGLNLTVVHVNHGIRREAAEDASFVETICRQQEIPFYLKEADIRKLAAEKGCSEEEAGRNYRYAVFEEVADKVGAVRIAVAHNMNDRGETMLFHLFRGTGIKGLAGIPPVRGKIIRPLLCVERAEIEVYLRQKGQTFCHDITNDSDDYTRNRIRHHILQFARDEIAPGCVACMAQTADILVETEDYLEQETCTAMKACICKEQNRAVTVDCEKLLEFHPVIRKRVLLELVNLVAPGVRDIGYVHAGMLYELLMKAGNRQLYLPYHIRAVRQYGQITVLVQSDESKQQLSTENNRAEFAVIEKNKLPHNEENSVIFPENQYTKWFDYDKIKKSPVFRTRQKGDYLTIRDGKGKLCHKKLKDYMMDVKIPPNERDFVMLLAEDSHVIWAVNYRVSEYYKVSENTKRVLQVQLIKEE